MATKKKVNRIAIVLDDSGSMNFLRDNCVAAFNANVDTIIAQARKTHQRTAVSLYLFSGPTQIDCKYVNVTVGEVKRLTSNEYSARGTSTALYDAVGVAIKNLENTPVGTDEDVSNLVIILTDGFDNSSREFNPSTLRSLITRVQNTDRWTFAFSVPNGSKAFIEQSLGVHSGNIQEWEQTTAGMTEFSKSTSLGTQSFYGARAAGQSSVTNFYTDLSGVKSSNVKKILTDLTAEVKVLKVEKEGRIREFVEAKTKSPLLKGAAFYQLTKSEKKVQKGKQILVMEKGKSAIYGGPEARDLLGLPDTDVKVIPGNHANFDIFVQSTSTNRILVRGTKLLYYPAIGIPYQEGPSAAVISSNKKSSSFKAFRK